MKLFIHVCAVLCALALTTTAFAYPSLLGPTGGANLPNASVIAQGEGTLAIDAQFYDANTTGLDNAYAVRALRGIGQNTELGVTLSLQQIDGAPSDVNEDAIGINAKYLLVNNPEGVSLGVGGIYQSFVNADNNVNYLSNYSLIVSSVQSMTQWYGVLTAKLSDAGHGSPVIRGSVGVNVTTTSVIVEDSDVGTWTASPSATRPFASLDLGFPAKMNGMIHLTGEYQVKDETFDLKPITSLVLRVPISRGGAFELGASNATNGVFGDSALHAFAGLEIYR